MRPVLADTDRPVEFIEEERGYPVTITADGEGRQDRVRRRR